MIPGTAAARPLAAAATLALAVAGCGQVRAGDQTPETADPEATSAEVRRLADGVADNALSAVASRLSGIAVQPTVSPAAVEAQWDQFSRLCDLP